MSSPLQSTVPRVWPLVLAMLAGCDPASGQPGSETPRPAEPLPARATRVETAVLHPADATFSFRLSAELQASKESHLAAAQGGFVERVMVEVGDEVRANQVLARVDSALYGTRLASTRVALDQAERDLDRAERLGDAISTAQLEAAQSAEQAARAAHRTAGVQASRSVIRAPFAGIVADVNVERGEVVGPGDPVVHLVQLDPILARLALADRELVVVHEGQTVQVLADAVPTPVEGRVTRIHPAADRRTRSFEVEIEAANAERVLRPGMLAQILVTLSLGAEHVIIPQDVLVTRGTGNGVFVREDDVARWRALSLGPVVRNQVVVLGGIAGGDELIVTGHRELTDGDRIAVVRSGRCCESGRVVFAESP